jgi:hypothetical protein
VAATNFQADSLEVTAADLAAALKLRWWKHELRFDPPVTSVTATLYELERNSDGEWRRIRLAEGVGIGGPGGIEIETATLSLVVPRDGEQAEFSVSLSSPGGGVHWHITPEITPDFSNMGVIM